MSRHSIVLGDKRVGNSLQGETKLWTQLCEQAANEQNPKRLIEMIKEINEFFEEKGRRGGWNHCGKNPRTNLLPLRIAFGPERR